MRKFRLLLPLFVAITLTGLSATGLAANVLKDHPSPYLAMHGDDPVNWQEWGDAVFEQARKQNKLVYVSIGYFACHWCHVMQRESYQNEKIAKFLNDNFIAVKVDRELQPALDSKLIDFVERTRGHAGWPLNVFITPQGHPLVGIVYLPPANFLDLLVNIDNRWEKDADELKDMAEDASEVMTRSSLSDGPDLAKDLGEVYTSILQQDALARADELLGGFGEQTKFPMSPQLSALLTVYEKNHDEILGNFLKLTLDQMMSQGLVDHLAGGFYRYTVDPAWQIPHFEKMLYNNAMLADLYRRAANIFKSDAYDRVARQTLDFMLTTFRDADGVFIASLSAVDGKGIEGGSYLWQDKQLDKLLSKQQRVMANTVWKLDHAPALDAGHHLVRKQSMSEASVVLKMDQQQLQKELKQIRKKLLVERNKRSLPRDTKRLGAWNALALKAFANAAAQYKESRYRDAARAVRNYLVNKLWDGKRLQRAIGKRGAFGEAALEDYAYVAEGMLAWSKLTGKDRKVTGQIIEQGWQRFYSPKGWQQSEKVLVQYGAREPVISDGSLPSASAVLIRTSLDYARLINNNELEQRALAALNVGFETLSTAAFWYATQIDALQYATQQ
ncbi:MAG TPA: thioredoxin domain-containing protein [Gammaproteobacteria bacterium]|nr:thioredoxin domain-containing protein [Gammaproteobacteria bacterium]